MFYIRSKLIIIIIATFIVAIFLLVYTYIQIVNNPTISSSAPGKQLTDLKTDAVFYVQPQGVQMNGSITQTPAQNRLTDFDQTTSKGPEVKEKFVSDRSVGEIYQFYEQLAAKDGWQLRNSGTNGYAETWTKTFPGSVTGFLSLENSENDPNGHIYTLSGSLIETSK